MKITFCGAAGTTTGSQHLLEVNGQRILLDCGLYQGRRKDAHERNLHFRFTPSEVDCVVLSHAHIDHSGNLPNLARQGFSGNIFTTFATRDLCSIMLVDSAKIQASDCDYLNRKKRRDGLPEIEALYSQEDAERCLRQFVNIGYGRSIVVADGVKVTFIDAGHILGSAQVILDIREFATGREFRLLFSGDVGRGNNALLRDPEVAEDVDYVIMESTYGGREHEHETVADDHMGTILQAALKGRGKVIIPSFAVERTQQLLYVLHKLREAGKIKRVPIHVDSPLAVNATEIFRLHPECFNEEVYNALFEKQNPFGFEGLSLIRSVTQSKALNENDDSCIIISASGMCESGRILHHLKNNIGDSKNTVLFVGYCAEQTLGWKIREGWEEVKIFGQPYQVRAEVEIMDCFSGHADHGELLAYFERITGKKEKVFLVHGETSRTNKLKEALDTSFGEGRFHAPKLGDSVEF